MRTVVGIVFRNGVLTITTHTYSEGMAGRGVKVENDGKSGNMPLHIEMLQTY